MLTEVLSSLRFRFAAEACGTNSGLLPNIWDGLCNAGDSAPNIDSAEQLLLLVSNVLRILIALAGMLAVVAILVAAVFYVISAGDAARVKRAKDALTNLVIGLVLIIGAYALVTFVAGAF